MKRKEKQEIPHRNIINHSSRVLSVKMTGQYTLEESPKLLLGMKNYSVTEKLPS